MCLALHGFVDRRRRDVFMYRAEVWETSERLSSLINLSYLCLLWPMLLLILNVPRMHCASFNVYIPFIIIME